MPIQQYSGKATSINKTKSPAVYNLVKKRYGWQCGTKNFDIGGGAFDTLSQSLSLEGVLNLIYDPYNRDKCHNDMVLSTAKESDTVTISNVLNIIQEIDARKDILSLAKDYLATDGSLYIVIYEGNKSGVGKRTGPDQWQNNKVTSEYIKEVELFFTDVTVRGNLIVARNK